MRCQKDIAADIVDQGADYMLAVKDNHPQLAADISELFNQYHEGELRRLPSALMKPGTKDTGAQNIACTFKQS